MSCLRGLPMVALVIHRNLFFSALLALSAPGCAGEGDDADLPQQESVCRGTQSVCTASTICGETGCERAFDRTYEVRLESVRPPGKRDGECPDARNCLSPRVTVYFSERDEPILGPPDAPRVAGIVVTEGSSLIVEVGVTDCMIELTPARLDSGEADCRNGTMSATLSLVAMPL